MRGGYATNQATDTTPNLEADALKTRTDAYAIYATQENDGGDYWKIAPTYAEVDDDGIDYLSIPHANYLYLSTIRGGCRMANASSCGCKMNGGCFECNKGSKNIMHIYSVIHIIIPSLYSKYKLGKEKAGIDAIKYRKVNNVNVKPKKNKKI